MIGATGPSGSGRSTFPPCLAGLDTAGSGSVVIGEVDLTRLSRSGLAGRHADPRGVGTTVDALGLRERLEHRPAEVSGPHRQTVITVTHDPVAAAHAVDAVHARVRKQEG